MQFPRVYFPDIETAEKVLDLSDPCGGRLYVNTFVDLANIYLNYNRNFVPPVKQIYDEFFITQKEYDNAKIIFDKRAGCYRIDFQVDNCYWDDRSLRRGPRYQIEDMATELSLHYHACQKVEEARAREEPRVPKMDYWEREALLDDIYAATHPPIMPIPVYGSIYGGTDWFCEE